MKIRTTNPSAKTQSPTVTLADVEAWLARQSKDHLLEQVKTDERLRERLLLKAAHTAAKGLDLDHYRNVPSSFVRAAPSSKSSFDITMSKAITRKTI